MTKTNKKVVIITAQGFEDEELIYPAVRLFEDNFQVFVAVKNRELVTGRFGFPLDYLIKNHAQLVDAVTLNSKDYDAVLIPGGFEAPDRVRQIPEVLEFVKEMNKAGKIVAAFCHGPWVLISAGVISGKPATCYKGMSDDLINAGAKYLDEPVIQTDDNIITGRHPRDIGVFMQALLAKLKA